jgi:hypothetical protein
VQSRSIPDPARFVAAGSESRFRTELLAVRGRALLERATPPVPEQAVDSTKEDLQWAMARDKSAARTSHDREKSAEQLRAEIADVPEAARRRPRSQPSRCQGASP